MKLFWREPDALVLKAQRDSGAREELIRKKEQDILKIASKACAGYVSKSDDEWSVALCAFSRAIDSYEKDRGDFMGFAATLIRHDLIDYHRHEALHSAELSVSPAVFEGDGEEEESAVTYSVACSLAASGISAADNRPGEEIAALAAVLNGFGFSFMDLTDCSPRQERTRCECLKVSSFLASDRALYEKMMRSHQLPSSELIRQTGVSGKTLDKYRKYIIASAIILSDEYPYLAGYLKPSERRQQT